MEKVCNIYVASDDVEVKSECLRVIANAIAEVPANCWALLKQEAFIEKILKELSEPVQTHIDLTNKQLAVLYNFTNDFEPACKYFAKSKLASQAIKNLIKQLISQPHLNIEQLSSIVCEIWTHEGATEHYIEENSENNEMMDILIDLCNHKSYNGVFDNGIMDAVSMLATYIESSLKLEDYFAKNSSNLIQLIKLGMSINGLLKDSNNFPILARRMLAIMGNISSRPSFTDTVEISKDDPVVRILLQHIREDESAQSGKSGVSHHDAGQGHSKFVKCIQAIAFLILGNLVVNQEQAEKLHKLDPSVIQLAMKYLSTETDPFALQSAHFIKNMTTNNPANAKEVIQRGGMALVGKLLGNKLFPNLRFMGARIAFNLLKAQTVQSVPGRNDGLHGVGTQRQILSTKASPSSDVLPIHSQLCKAYEQEDDERIRNEIILALDAAVDACTALRKSILNNVDDGDGVEMQDLEEVEDKIAIYFINYLHNVYLTLLKTESNNDQETSSEITDATIVSTSSTPSSKPTAQQVLNPIILLKVTKSLGVLSTFKKSISYSSAPSKTSVLTLEEGRQSSGLHFSNNDSKIFLLEALISEYDDEDEGHGHKLMHKLIDLLDSFSTKIKAIELEIQRTSGESKGYRGVVNNLGFLGSQVVKWDCIAKLKRLENTEVNDDNIKENRKLVSALQEAAKTAIRNATQW